jgi:histone H3/H4
MSNLANKTQGELQQIVDIAERELQNAQHTPFSSNAFNRLKEKISEYSIQLITESTKVARRHKSESVSTSDVEHASQYLVSSTSHKIYRHMGTIGGILLGTAASNILAMITTQQYTLTGIVVTFVLTLLGTFMIAVHIVKD